MSSKEAFELWLEWETGEPLDQPANRAHKNFGNVVITLADGRTYALNVWTFDFLPHARFPWPYEPQATVRPANYVLPPDLFVESLERPVLEAVVTAMLKAGELKDAWLRDRDT